MADSYESFAQVYDELMDNVPYEQWAEQILGILREYDITDGILCDLGCGTGSMTMLLRDAGYDMIGIDCSEDMLGIAREKQYLFMDEYEDEDAELEDGLSQMNSIMYLLQDMREFELYGTVRACISICDSVNYILEEEELLQTFRLVNNYLDPKGLFLFDFNTVHKYRDVIGDSVIAENREDCSFIWENNYDAEKEINEYDLTIFVQEEDDLFTRFHEMHYQRGYTLETMKRLIEESGLVFVRAFDSDTLKEADDESQRIFVIAMEQGK